jgi:hypothetical protein
MKLAAIMLCMLAFPLATMWAENREETEERRAVNRMADRARAKPIIRRMRYATIGGKLKKPCGSGSSHKATRKTHILSIAGNGGKVNG